MEIAGETDLFIAPLKITKDCSRTSSNTSSSSQKTVTRQSEHEASRRSGQLTPPLTPQSSGDDLHAQREHLQPSFQTYLRAFYPYHPTHDESSSTVTLPLNCGDIILVHSVHTNGWADGTLLSSGARGWLPTNYCEAYSNEPIRILLKALTKFWDLAKSGRIGGLKALSSQDCVRGLVAGVRCLLERTRCLNRESSIIQSHQGLRRYRKALLTDLSSFVKTAKILEDISMEELGAEAVEVVLDETIKKAFRMVIRAVKFLDLWDEDLVLTQSIDTVPVSCYVPPTPPAERSVFGPSQDPVELDRAMTAPLPEARDNADHGRERLTSIRPRYSRSSQTFIRPGSAEPCAQDARRQSISHRLSICGNATAAIQSNLASTKLSESHDTFLGFLGSFIGLHLQSRSSSDLLVITQQSVISCQSLLRVVEDIYDRDQQRSDLLRDARENMYNLIYDLVEAAREIFHPSQTAGGADILLPTEGKVLMDAATACVRGAGECVAESRYVLEYIGDFAFEPLGSCHLPAVGESPSAPEAAEVEPHVAENTLRPTEPTKSPPPPPIEQPVQHPSPTEDMVHQAPATSPKAAKHGREKASSGCSTADSLLPPLPAFASPLLSQEDYCPSVQSSFGSYSGECSTTDSLDVSSSFGGASTFMNSPRDSESSAASQASTRATSPDHAFGAASTCGSFSTSQVTFHDDSDEGEVKVLEKTYAHELIYNKDGQISGGTLPALIERLTTHDSTPDASFVSTFYLTFRLFATPVQFAQALIDRFQYVSESPRIAGPVRLRVYNVFKGWLESHWRHECDNPALELIVPFANRQLLIVLPTAGKRLAALAVKVTDVTGPLVPRLISSIGKTNTSIASYVAPDTPMPTPIISKNQLNLLKNWKYNGAVISILDFDPLELARQFTLKESQIFCSILPEELLATEWTKKSSSMAVNVRAMSRLSTDLANLVADCILQLEDPKKRATIIKQWVKIAKKCLQLENYDSLMAIICSLNSSTILRLKRTWDQVSSKTKAKLENLKDVVDVSRNYAVLRQRLQNTVPPCLPFVGTYLTDLTFVDVGNQTTRQLPSDSDDTASVPVINFDKHMKTAKIISELQRFQIPYRFTEVPELQTWMQDQLVRVRSSDQANVQNYYRRSLLLEPRETTQRPH